MGSVRRPHSPPLSLICIMPANSGKPTRPSHAAGNVSGKWLFESGFQGAVFIMPSRTKMLRGLLRVLTDHAPLWVPRPVVTQYPPMVVVL